MKKILASIVLISFVFGLSGCHSKKNSPENQIIKYNLDSEPKSLDPQIANDYSSNILIMNLFEGLVRIDENFNIVPGVAQSWETSSNNTLYIFHLRHDACFSNKEKTPLTAHDFVFGLKRALDKNTAAPKASSLYCIKNAKNINLNGAPTSILGVTAIDDHTLSIELEYENKEFLETLATPIAMPCNESFFYSVSGQYGLEPKTVLSNGPFKIKPRYGWEHFKSINLVKNEAYVGETLPISAGISFTIGEDTSNAAELIKNETLDACLLPMNQLSAAKNFSLKLTSFKDTVWGITFNLDNPTVSNSNIRKGFIKSINRDYILNYVPENCTIANDIVLDSMTVNGQSYRDAAGHNLYMKQDSSAKVFFDKGIKELGLKSSPNISIACIDDPTVKSMVSNLIENLNSTLNCYFNMNPVSKGDLTSAIANSNFQVAVVPIQAENDSVLDFLGKFKSDSSKNIVNLKSKEYDSILAAAAAANPADSLKYLISAEKYLNDNANFYPLYNEERYYACSPKVSGIIFHEYIKGIDFLKSKKSK